MRWQKNDPDREQNIKKQDSGESQEKTHRGTGSVGGGKGGSLTIKYLKCDPDPVYPVAIEF